MAGDNRGNCWEGRPQRRRDGLVGGKAKNVIVWRMQKKKENALGPRGEMDYRWAIWTGKSFSQKVAWVSWLKKENWKDGKRIRIMPVLKIRRQPTWKLFRGKRNGERRSGGKGGVRSAGKIYSLASQGMKNLSVLPEETIHRPFRTHKNQPKRIGRLSGREWGLWDETI